MGENGGIQSVYPYEPVHDISVLFVSTNIKCSCDSAHMRRHTRAFAAHIHCVDVDECSHQNLHL